MAFVRMIFALPLIVGAVLFALAHPEKVTLTYSPLSAPIELPLYFVALVFLGIGFLLGVFLAWLGMSKVRKERRAFKKEIKKLTKENDKLTQEQSKLQNKLEKTESPEIIQGN